MIKMQVENNQNNEETINSAVLKSGLLKLKTRLENLENQLQIQIQDLEEREAKWVELDKQVDDIMKYQNSIVRINVSGKKFATKVETLLSLKDTLFYKLILSKKFDLSQEIFFDRSPRLFSVIIDYLRYKKIYYKRFSSDELDDLKVEADYYEIAPISEYLKNRMGTIDLVGFEFSSPYLSGINPVGTNNINDLKDRNLNTGICANIPGWIIIELNREFEIDELEIGGFNGNTNYWSPENGANAQIQTSLDKATWVNVGTIPYGFGTQIKTVNVTKTIAKYIKFSNNSYLGIGYLEIKQKN